MPPAPETIARLAKSVQPLVFETNIPEFPYSIYGTVFLVGYDGDPFILTTRHSLSPEKIFPICIFPSDTSRKFLPLADIFFVPHECEAEDFMDLAVIGIDTSRIHDLELAEATLIDIALASSDWENCAEYLEFIIIGFPEDHAFVDYIEEELHAERVCLSAQYIGRSSMPFLHEIEITTPHSLTTFSGFSGSPVFAYINEPSSMPRIALCGMVVRGTAKSSRMHFLERSVLVDAIIARNIIGR